MIVYKTTNLVNGKIYIGKDSNNDKYYLGGGKLLKQAIKKYGRKNFKKEVLEECKSPEELNEREIYWINELKSRESAVGYNITVGGEISPMDGNIHSDETKIKMSLNHVDVSGENNPMYGKSFEDVWRENGLTESEIANKKEGWLKNHNTFFKDNNPFQSVSRFGTDNPFYGKTHTDEVKNKLKEKSNRKTVLQYSLDSNLLREWDSTMDVYRELNINCRNCCRGLTKTAGGYKWEYKIL